MSVVEHIKKVQAFQGTAGIWTQDLLFTKQALSPAKPQYLHESLLLKLENEMPWSSELIINVAK